jgi:hypothetical protein
MIHVKAPNRVKTVFLAGSIEMGKAEMWQDRLAAKVADIEDVVLFNPRRDVHQCLPRHQPLGMLSSV